MLSVTKGGATAEATSKFCSHFKQTPSVVPKKGWHASRIGLGTHRTSSEEAIVYGIKGGFNVIDTASWFQMGAAEKAVGRAIHQIIEQEPYIKRESLVVINKCGPVAASLLQRIPSHIAESIMDIPSGAKHSISPEFIEWCIGHSLTNMKLDRIDLWGLDGIHRLAAVMEHGRLLDKVATAFEHLEKEVVRGRISGFFLSVPHGNVKGPIDLDQVLKLIQPSNLDNFVAMQFPFNIYERACLEHDGLGAWCRKNKLFQLHNRPLNAISPAGTVTTLSSGLDSVKRALTGNHQVNDEEIQRATAELTHFFQEGEELEKTISDRVMDELDSEDANVPTAFVWSHALMEHSSRLMENPLATRHFITSTLKPNLEDDIATVLETTPSLGKDSDFMKQLTRLKSLLLNDIASRMEFLATQTSASQNHQLNTILRSVIPPGERPMDLLSATALKWTSTAQPGAPSFTPPFDGETVDVDGAVAKLLGETVDATSCTLLVGARSVEYVEVTLEVLSELKTKPFTLDTWRKVAHQLE